MITEGFTEHQPNGGSTDFTAGQPISEFNFRDQALEELFAQGAVYNSSGLSEQVIPEHVIPVIEWTECSAEAEEEAAEEAETPEKYVGASREFSDVKITPGSLETTDRESAKFLRDLDVRQLIVLKDGESRKVGIEFSQTQTMPINRAGCRDVLLKESVGGRLTASADGKSVVISDIRGVEATVDLPEELQFIGGDSTTVTVKKLSFFERDGVSMMEITGSKFDVDLTRTVPVPSEIQAIRAHMERLAENLGDQPVPDEDNRRLVENLTNGDGMPLYLKLALLAAGIGVLARRGHPLSVPDLLFGRARGSGAPESSEVPESRSGENPVSSPDGIDRQASPSSKSGSVSDGAAKSADEVSRAGANNSKSASTGSEPALSADSRPGPTSDSVGSGTGDTITATSDAAPASDSRAAAANATRPRIESITTVDQMRTGQRLPGFGGTPMDILAVSPEADLVVINPADNLTLEAPRTLAPDVASRIIRIAAGDKVYFCDPVTEHVYQASAEASKYQQVRGAEVRLRGDILRETTNAIAEDPTYRLVGENTARYLQLANSGQEIRSGADMSRGLTEYVRQIGAAQPPASDSTLTNALRERMTVVVDPALPSGQSRLIYIGDRVRKEIVLSRQDRGSVRNTGTVVDRQSLSEGRFEIRVAADFSPQQARSEIAIHVSQLSGRVDSNSDTGRDLYARRNTPSEALEQAARTARGVDLSSLTPEQRRGRVIEILEATEQELGRQGWSAAERDRFRRVIDRYRQGRVSAEVIVHRHLDIRTNNPPPGSSGSVPPSDGRPSGGGGGAGGNDASSNNGVNDGTTGRAPTPSARELDTRLAEAERNMIRRAAEEWNSRFLAKIPTNYDTRFEILLRSVVVKMRLEQSISPEISKSLLAQVERYGSNNPAVSAEASRRFSELTTLDLKAAGDRAAVQARANPFPGAPERVIIEGTTKISVHKDGIVIEAGRDRAPLTLTRDEIIKALDERISELEKALAKSGRVDEREGANLEALKRISESYKKGAEIRSGVAKALAAEAMRRNPGGRPPIGGTIVGAAVIVSTVMRYMNEDN